MSRFHWLVVCTGNICRSPLAEALLRQGLERRLGPAAAGFEVASAGTRGLIGEPMDPDARAALRDLGCDAEGFRARRLDRDLVAGADLVTTATLSHRGAAVSLLPRASARTFTLLELSRLCAAVDPAELPADDPVERARSLVRAAAGRRGLAPPPREGDDDVPDPYGLAPSVHRRAAAAIAAALSGPLDLLAAPWVALPAPTVDNPTP